MSDADNEQISSERFMHHLDNGWAELQSFINTLTPEQMTLPADAAGWTVKDHLMHLAVWEDGMNAVLAHEPRISRMMIDEALWKPDNIEAINAGIRERTRDLSLDAVLTELQRVHSEFRGRVAPMSTADLLRPYSEFQPDSKSDEAVVWRLAGNTFGHYEEHLPWMRTIVAQS